MPEQNGQGELHERPIAELLKELSYETTTLVRKELELAKAEMAEKGKKAGVGAGMFGGAGVAGFLGLAVASAAAVAALATGMATWLAAFIVAVLWLLAAAGLGLTGKNKVQEAVPPVPEQTIENAKEDVQWVKTRAKSARK